MVIVILLLLLLNPIFTPFAYSFNIEIRFIPLFKIQRVSYRYRSMFLLLIIQDSFIVLIASSIAYTPVKPLSSLLVQLCSSVKSSFQQPEQQEQPELKKKVAIRFISISAAIRWMASILSNIEQLSPAIGLISVSSIGLLFLPLGFLFSLLQELLYLLFLSLYFSLQYFFLRPR